MKWTMRLVREYRENEACDRVSAQTQALVVSKAMST